MYEQTLPYIENAIKLASATPDAGYQFTAQEIRVDALISLRQFDTAQRIIEDVLTHARETHRTFDDAAARVFGEVLVDSRRLLGPDHPLTSRAAHLVNQVPPAIGAAGEQAAFTLAHGLAVEIWDGSPDQD